MQAAKVNPLRIGVAALNVHSGEGGLFGREEIEAIAPAIRMAEAEGYAVVGPVPADSLFLKALQGDYAGLVCMYTTKPTSAGRSGPRATWCDPLYGDAHAGPYGPHGTAYDIAWKGVAREAMLARAVMMAAAIAKSDSDGWDGAGSTDKRKAKNSQSLCDFCKIRARGMESRLRESSDIEPIDQR